MAAKIFVSKPMQVKVRDLENAFYRADLEFHGIDHSGASFEARVFLNSPEADENTPKAPESKYAGSFHIFGHGGCFGDIDHCEVVPERRSYDKRRPHPLTPASKRLNVTDALRKLGADTDEIIVTVVPVVMGGTDLCDLENVLRFKKLSLVTYDE